MKQYILFTNEELDDMIHGCELSISIDGKTLYFMAEEHYAQLDRLNGVDEVTK